LGIRFHMKRGLDLSKIHKVKESEWSPELRARTSLFSSTANRPTGIADASRQLAAVDMQDLNSGHIRLDTVRKTLAPDFLHTFKSLLAVMAIQETKQRAKDAREARAALRSGNSPTSLKRAATSTPRRRQSRRGRNTTHHHLRNLGLPTNLRILMILTSAASLPNPRTRNTRRCYLNSLYPIYSVFLKLTSASRNGNRVVTSWNYVRRKPAPFPQILSSRERDSMTFRLGMETVRPINDGGLGIRYNLGTGFVDWQPGGTRPVLSLEVQLR